VAAALGAAGCGSSADDRFTEGVRKKCSRSVGSIPAQMLPSPLLLERFERLHERLAQLAPPKDLAEPYARWLRLQRDEIRRMRATAKLAPAVLRQPPGNPLPSERHTVTITAHYVTSSRYRALTSKLGFGSC
jgi:hypothetical protein